MDDLIKALQIIRKYTDDIRNPTNCAHDTLYLCVDPGLIPDKEIQILDDLGFFVSEENECFISYRFGSC